MGSSMNITEGEGLQHTISGHIIMIKLPNVLLRNETGEISIYFISGCAKTTKCFNTE